MKPNRSLIFGLYGVGVLLIVVAPTEALLGAWPFRFGETQWRFAAAGVLSQALLTGFLGVGLVVVLGFVLRHRKILRVVGLSSGAVAAGLFLLVGLFLLDGIEMRAQVPPEAMRRFYLTFLLAFSKMSAGVVVGVLMAVGSWKATVETPPKTRATVVAAPGK